jgi:hypothetical protein
MMMMNSIGYKRLNKVDASQVGATVNTNWASQHLLTQSEPLQESYT